MDPRFWLLLHYIGFATWVAGLVGVGLLLAASRQDARVGGIARNAGRIADLGATLALVGGLVMFIQHQLYRQPYFHIKLTLVVVLMACHGILLGKAKKASRGDGAPATGVLLLVALVALGIFYLMAFRPFSR
jgi:uncharacterized membrane protein